MLIEAGAQRALVSVRRASLGEHHEVEWRQLGLQPEGLARQALESITVHGAFRGPARNRQTEARDRAAARSAENGEKTIGRSRGLCEDATEFGRCVQALLGCEPFPARQQCGAKMRPVTG